MRTEEDRRYVLFFILFSSSDILCYLLSYPTQNIPKTMFYNTPKNLVFRGALNVNRLRDGAEKLPTIGGECGGKLSCPGLA